MSKLDELTRELCPDGVEYKNLKDVCTFNRGKSLVSKNAVNGNVPVISGGKKPAFYHNESNRNGITITVAGSGAYAGYVSIWYEPIFCCDAFSVDPIDEKIINVKYLYHFLLSKQNKIYHKKTGAGIPHVHGKDIAKLKIPMPPLEVQEEIVRILDNFTELTAELTAELTVRKQQYEYYRNILLTFDDNMEWNTLEELLQPKGYIRGPFGSALKKEFFVEEGIPVYEQQHAIYDKRTFRYFIDGDRAEKLKRFMVKPNDIIISCSGTIGKISIITSNDKIGIINQALLILRFDLSKVKIKYIKYYLECFTNLIVTSSGGAITNIEKRAVIERIRIPVPPLSKQQHIIDILGWFDQLCNDISVGLPAEIEARKKQYEYYRDKLLTFKEKIS